MQHIDPCGRFYRWGAPGRAGAADRFSQEWQPGATQVVCEEWVRHPKAGAITPDEILEGGVSIAHALWARLAARSVVRSTLLRVRSEQLRSEFETLTEQWRKDTHHLSQVSKKVTHPAYFRIIGMGEAVVPLLLEKLRDRPSHWFVALQATANANPVADGASPAQAREAWLEWGKSRGLID